MKKPKPIKWFTLLKTAPKGPKDNGHRRADPQVHSNPDQRTDPQQYPGRVVPSVSWATYAALFSLPEPKPIPNARIRAGEIIGHRLWWVTHQGLCSAGHYFIWEPGAVVEGNVNKLRTCTIRPTYEGVYSYKGRSERFTHHRLSMTDHLRRAYLDTPLSALMNVGVASGRIACWGEVIEHEYGYRAQYARIVSIDHYTMLPCYQEVGECILRLHLESIYGDQTWAYPLLEKLSPS